MSIRKPCVAGSFYPADAASLREFCETHLRNEPTLLQARAVILPHAGYIYSGVTACETLSRVAIPSKNLLIGPNHRGLGSEFALWRKGAWETPLGKVAIAEDLSSALLKDSRHLAEEENAHLSEHSLEVLLPFLQTRNPDLTIVPLIVGTLDLDRAREVALECVRALRSLTENICVVISNDMSHYESDEATRKKDRYALDAIQALDDRALVKAVRQHRVTMCGYMPVYMLLVMAEALGIQKATLVDYRTSAEASGDYDRVVGYAGFIFE